MSGSPQRIQRRRVKGWRLPEGAVIVSRPTKWGNPFRVGATITDELFTTPGFEPRTNGVPKVRSGVVEDRAHALDLWWFWTLARVPFTHAEVRAELGGKDLVCWCPLPAPGEPDVCHAAVLLRIANGRW